MSPCNRSTSPSDSLLLSLVLPTVCTPFLGYMISACAITCPVVFQFSQSSFSSELLVPWNLRHLHTKPSSCVTIVCVSVMCYRPGWQSSCPSHPPSWHCCSSGWCPSVAVSPLAVLPTWVAAADSSVWPVSPQLLHWYGSNLHLFLQMAMWPV